MSLDSKACCTDSQFRVPRCRRSKRFAALAAAVISALLAGIFTHQNIDNRIVQQPQVRDILQEFSSSRQLFGVAEDLRSEAEKAGAASVFADYPRYDFQFNKVERGFAPGDASYRESIIMAGMIPGGALAAVLFALCMVFVLLRHWCGMCGGRTRKPYYSRRSKGWYRAQVFAYSAFAIAIASFIYADNADMDDISKNAAATLTDTIPSSNVSDRGALYELNILANAEAGNLTAARDSVVRSAADSLRASAENFAGRLSRRKSEVEDGAQYRRSGVLLTSCVFLVAGILGLSSILFSRSRVALLAGELAFFGAMFAFASGGALTAVSVAGVDICSQLDKYVAREEATNAAVDEFIARISTTIRDESYQAMVEATQSAVDFQISELNNEAAENISCCTIYATTSNISDVQAELIQLQTNMSVSSGDREAASRALVHANETIDCINRNTTTTVGIESLGDPLENDIFDTMAAFHASACQTLAPGLWVECFFLLGGGAFMTLLIVAGIKGSKRIGKDDAAAELEYQLELVGRRASQIKKTLSKKAMRRHHLQF